MEPVLVHHRLDRWHLGDLMPDRFGIIAMQLDAASATLLRLALEDLPESFGRDQGTGVMAMVGLATPPLTRWANGRPSLD